MWYKVRLIYKVLPFLTNKQFKMMRFCQKLGFSTNRKVRRGRKTTKNVNFE